MTLIKRGWSATNTHVYKRLTERYKDSKLREGDGNREGEREKNFLVCVCVCVCVCVTSILYACYVTSRKYNEHRYNIRIYALQFNII